MHHRDNRIRFIFLFFDIVILNAIVILLAWLRSDIILKNYYDSSIYLLISNLALFVNYIIFIGHNLYLRDSYIHRVKAIAIKSFNISLIVGLISTIFLRNIYLVLFLYECIAVFFICELVFYKILYAILKYRRSKGFHMNRVLIIGEDENTEHLREMIESNPLLGYKFAGFVSNNANQCNNVGTPDQLPQLIKKHQIQMIFVSTSLFSDQEDKYPYSEICSSMCVRLRYVTKSHYGMNARIGKESFGRWILIDPLEIPLDNWSWRLCKRLSDIIISSLAIFLVFSWLFPILAILIKLNSKGPVFFVQRRTGLNKKTFNCIKFRSMQMNNLSNRMQAQKYDSRITVVGHFLRKTNLDELPQFFNVLMGQMSVVGPRPHMLRHTGQYAPLVDQYLFRHFVKPGVTGWAQVNGYRGETKELWKMQKRVEYDLEYIENWNFWWDFIIIWKTIFSSYAYESNNYKPKLANEATTWH